MQTEFKIAKTVDLIPYARNSRTHSDAQVAKIAASIKEFGFLNPVIVDGDNGIIAGHGRIMAAQKLGIEEVPTIEAAYLSEAQKRAYIIADNRLALDAGWDDELLKIELKDLDVLNFDLTLTGFDLEELADLFDDKADGLDNAENYSRKVEAPIYKITGEKPKVSDLYDRSVAESLISDIDAADIDKDIADFLKAAADRHTAFNFRNIAEFYAHSDATVQGLMEKSALVIIDFDQAVELGFVKLSEDMMGQVGKSRDGE